MPDTTISPANTSRFNALEARLTQAAVEDAVEKKVKGHKAEKAAKMREDAQVLVVLFVILGVVYFFNIRPWSWLIVFWFISVVVSLCKVAGAFFSFHSPPAPQFMAEELSRATDLATSLRNYHQAIQRKPDAEGAFVSLRADSEEYATAKASHSFTAQAQLLELDKQAIDGRWAADLAKFNQILTSIALIKKCARPVLDSLEEAIKQHAQPAAVVLPPILTSGNSFEYPRNLEAKAITQSINNFSKAFGMNAARTVQTRDATAALILAGATLAIGTFMYAKYTRQLEELAGAIRVYHTEAHRSIKVLGDISSTRIELMMSMLVESLNNIRSIVDRSDAELGWQNVDAESRNKLAFEIHKAKKLLALPIG